jgi:hypothetical protein
MDGELSAKVSAQTKIVGSRLHFTSGPHSKNKERKWTTRELVVKAGMLLGDAPPTTATAWYVDVTDERKVVASSEVMVK